MCSLKDMKPYASISIDLDDQWTYLKSNGNDAWRNYPSYFGWLLPRILNFMEDNDLKITFFLVGKDCGFERNHDHFKNIAENGHEVGNHSYSHNQWMADLPIHEIEKEIVEADAAIFSLIGEKPVGYRGPGYSFSSEIAGVLAAHHYLYDGSLLSSFVGPLARLFFFFTSDFKKLDKEKRKKLFGSWKDGFRPNHPFLWSTSGRRLLEMPVTVMPFFRIPIHATYVLFLYQVNKKLALLFFRLAIRFCLMTRTAPSLLLHPPDFIGADDPDDLSFMPGLKLKVDEKLNCLKEIIRILRRHYEIVDMKKHAQSLRGDNCRRVSKELAVLEVGRYYN